MDDVSQSEHPRGVAFDRRIISAAVATYADTGWSGFSIVAVAQRAGAGKASIYTRWSNREQLLIDALKSELSEFEEINTGTLYDDLVALTESTLRRYLGPQGRAALRLGLDAHCVPELAHQHAAYQRAQLVAGQVILDRAINRGELPANAPSTTLLDSILGSALFYAAVKTSTRRSRPENEISKYAKELVELVLRKGIYQSQN